MTEEADEAGGRLLAYAEELNERIERCHEEVACPTCGAPVGVRCRRMPRGYVPPMGRRDGVTKHPHRERWTQVVPAR